MGRGLPGASRGSSPGRGVCRSPLEAPTPPPPARSRRDAQLREPRICDAGAAPRTQLLHAPSMRAGEGRGVSPAPPRARHPKPQCGPRRRCVETKGPRPPAQGACPLLGSRVPSPRKRGEQTAVSGALAGQSPPPTPPAGTTVPAVRMRVLLTWKTTVLPGATLYPWQCPPLPPGSYQTWLSLRFEASLRTRAGLGQMTRGPQGRECHALGAWLGRRAGAAPRRGGPSGARLSRTVALAPEQAPVTLSTLSSLSEGLGTAGFLPSHKTLQKNLIAPHEVNFGC